MLPCQAARPYGLVARMGPIGRMGQMSVGSWGFDGLPQPGSKFSHRFLWKEKRNRVMLAA